MVHEEGVQALIAQSPVVHRGIPYQRISALVYRRLPKSDGAAIQCELLCRCGHSFTLAQLAQVDWLNQNDRETTHFVPPVNEDGITPLEEQAKKAFWSGREVWYEGEQHIISALIVRRWVDYNYWLEVELSRITDRLIQTVWSGSVQYNKKG